MLKAPKHDDKVAGSAPHLDVEDDDELQGEVFPPEGRISETAAALNDAAGDRVALVQWAGDRFTAPADIIKAAKLPDGASDVRVPNTPARTSAASATPEAAGVGAKKAPAARNKRTTAGKASRERQAAEVEGNTLRDGGKPAERLDPAADGAEDAGTATSNPKSETRRARGTAAAKK